MKETIAKHKNTIVMLVLGFVMIGILLIIPTGYEDALIYQGAERAIGKVIEVDNSNIKESGLIQSGEQSCLLEIENGEFKGKQLTGVNFLSGSLEKDKVYEVGDRALVTISVKNSEPKSVVMSDHFRLEKELILLVAFLLFLVIFAGRNGVQAIFSFVITILMIWKILVPFYLNGYSPVWVGLMLTIILTSIIIFFVYGFDKKTFVGIAGSMLGILTTCILGIIFIDMFEIHGAIMPNAESLLYSGYQNLDLTAIYMSSIFIGASGAMMDLAVDITSSVAEVVKKKPEIKWKEAVISGMHVGKAAMGTMTTTLLLAYSGGYIALLMVFMAQGTPLDHILNYKYVAAEILDTIIGSFGLVTVAPFTALVAGIILTRHKK